ncbi:hypothetical protein V6N13_019815 [Hibiscus sabdariffa]
MGLYGYLAAEGEEDIFSSSSAYTFLTQGGRIRQAANPRWISPSEWWVKLNGDVVVSPLDNIDDIGDVVRDHHHIAVSDVCEIYGGGREDVEHVLCSCVANLGLWMRVVPNVFREEFLHFPFHDWITRNLFDKSCVLNDEAWSIKFTVLFWLLWKRRCSLLLDPELGAMEDILEQGDRIGEECNRAFPTISGGRIRQATNPRWIGPSKGWVKLNGDVVVSPLDNRDGIGDVVRYVQGQWLYGFIRYVGRCSFFASRAMSNS